MEETEGISEFYDTDTVRKFVLTEEAIEAKTELLRSNSNEMTEEQKAQLLANAVRHWDLFYKRNTDHFFKDRGWLAKELPEIAAACKAAEETGGDESPTLVDVGCGVGNALLPILLVPTFLFANSFPVSSLSTLIPLRSANPRIQATAFDCSPRGIAILRERWEAVLRERQEGEHAGEALQQLRASPPDSITASVVPSTRSRDSSGNDAAKHCSCQARDSERTIAVVQKPVAAAAAEAVAKGEAQIFHYPFGQLRTVAAFDITAGDVPGEIAAKGSANFVLLIFVLSALHPRHHEATATRCAEMLKPGGMVLFRDYGRLDMAQLRFAEQRKPKVEQNLYARYDGTLAYYFLKEEVEDLFCRVAGLEVVENRYCMREMLNRKTQQRMQRIWIQAKFRRPLS